MVEEPLFTESPSRYRVSRMLEIGVPLAPVVVLTPLLAYSLIVGLQIGFSPDRLIFLLLNGTALIMVGIYLYFMGIKRQRVMISLEALRLPHPMKRRIEKEPSRSKYEVHVDEILGVELDAWEYSSGRKTRWQLRLKLRDGQQMRMSSGTPGFAEVGAYQAILSFVNHLQERGVPVTKTLPELSS